jgi:hypothetical protein
LAFAVLIGLGPRYAFPLLLAECIASIVNYHQPVHSYIFQVGNIEFAVMYTAAAQVLRRVVKIDRRLRSVRDVIWLLLIALCTSCVVAFLGAGFLTLLARDAELVDWRCCGDRIDCAVLPDLHPAGATAVHERS